MNHVVFATRPITKKHAATNAVKEANLDSAATCVLDYMLGLTKKADDVPSTGVVESPKISTACAKHA